MTDQELEEDEFLPRTVLTVADVEKSIDYYCSKLGFETAWSYREDGEDQLMIAEVYRGGIQLIVQKDSAVQGSQGPVVTAISFYKERQLPHFHEELVERGALIRRAPTPVPWQEGVHQMEVEDLDGNVFLFWG